MDTRAQVRRALLIGIDTYTAEAQQGTVLASRDASTEQAERGSVRGWTDLDGAVNDARALSALLTTRFGFDEEEVRLLLNTDATREGILQALRDLIVESGPGDAVVFMYAGHGSQVRNTESKEADGRDESIVPADARLGVPDIRDKELRVLFQELLATGAEVTILFDSCHSGSVTRGVTPGKARSLKPSSEVISDGGALPPPPQDHPAALVISAAQDNELAKELKDGDGTPHGAFSWALASVLRTAAPDTPARDVFTRVRARMKGHGFAQEPVLAGQSVRLSGPLFGGATRGQVRSSPQVAVIETEGRTVILQGGLALGLRPDCELCAVRDERVRAPDTTLCVTVKRVEGLARSEATVTRGAAAELSPGQMMTVTRWVGSPAAPLRMWMPPALPTARILPATESIAALDTEEHVRLVGDPTVTPPTHVVQWTGRTWMLTDGGDVAVELGGPLPDVEVARRVLRGAEEVRLYVHFPPPPALREALQAALSDGGSIEVTSKGTAAHYVLVGRGGRGVSARLDYGWIYAPATESGGSPAMPPSVAPVAASNPTAAAAQLAEYAKRLNRVWGWIQLESPPPDGSFPYRLIGFEDADSGAFVALDDTLRWQHRYRAVVAADSAALQAVKSSFAYRALRHLYLFAITRQGDGYLLYGGENVENDIDLLDDIPDPIRFTIPGSGSLFTSTDGDGDGRPDVDTFFLLTTAEPITDPRGVFNFQGTPRGTSGNRGPREDTALARLFLNTGDGTRGFSQSVPTDWSLNRAPMISAP
ncbi:caspase family protein [Salinibacter sp. 10B]|uniref:caspase family protein n=1 Tax=Salinibacter sp. 10B TaxID=1923971 RepID=UPI0015E2E0A1|nr:caspase family protein [Salinibacter sp. 10B]